MQPIPLVLRRRPRRLGLLPLLLRVLDLGLDLEQGRTLCARSSAEFMIDFTANDRTHLGIEVLLPLLDQLVLLAGLLLRLELLLAGRLDAGVVRGLRRSAGHVCA